MGSSVSKSGSKSISKSSRPVILQSAASSASLSCFDTEISQVHADVAATILQHYNFLIRGIYIVSRPTNIYKSMDLQHWAVKMDATPCLITMDFSVCTDGNAGFSVEVVMKSQVEICDFFYYYQKIPKNKKGNNNNNNNSKKNKNNGDGRSYSNSIVHGDNGFDYRRLKWNVLSFVNPIKQMGDKSDIRVVDIADFIYSFTNSTGNYNAVTNNCQSFAYRLYKKVIGHKYPIKCSQIGKLLQSPHDQTKIKNESNNFDIGASARESDSDRDHTTRDARIRLDYRKLDNSDAGNINPHGAHPRASRNDDRLMRHEHHGQSGHHHHSKDEQRQHRHQRHGKHQPHHSTVQGATHPGEAI